MNRSKIERRIEKLEKRMDAEKKLREKSIARVEVNLISDDGTVIERVVKNFEVNMWDGLLRQLNGQHGDHNEQVQ